MLVQVWEVRENAINEHGMPGMWSNEWMCFHKRLQFTDSGMENKLLQKFNNNVAIPVFYFWQYTSPIIVKQCLLLTVVP